MHRQKTSIYSETIEHPNFKVFSGRNRDKLHSYRGFDGYRLTLGDGEGHCRAPQE